MTFLSLLKDIFIREILLGLNNLRVAISCLPPTQFARRSKSYAKPIELAIRSHHSFIKASILKNCSNDSVRSSLLVSLANEGYLLVIKI